MLFGDLDQKYFTSLCVCRYESLSTRHLEQIFSFLWQRAARSFPNNKLAVVNNFPGHGLNSLIQNIAFHSCIVEFDGSVSKSMYWNGYNKYKSMYYRYVLSLYLCSCVNAYKHMCIHTYYLCLKMWYLKLLNHSAWSHEDNISFRKSVRYRGEQGP